MSDLIEELREEQVSRLEEKVEALTKEIHAIKNPPKKKSPLDGLTTYEKVTKVVGEVIFIGLPIAGVIQANYQFFTGQRGIISTTLLTSLLLWSVCYLYDILAHNYGWKRKGKLD